MRFGKGPGRISYHQRGGGRRYYRPEDIHLLRGIRHLLYGEGYTIRGVQRILKEQGAKFVQSVWQPGAPQLGRRAFEDDADAVLDDADLGNAPAREVAERGRGLLALLPALLGDAETDDGLTPAEGRGEPLLPAPERLRSPARALSSRSLGPPSLER